MNTHKALIVAVGLAYALSFTNAFAATPLTAACVGSTTSTSVTWSATSTGGVSPVTYLWGNGSTAAVQTVTAPVGTHTMTLLATDASSTVATATCVATVAAASSTATSTNSVLEAKIKSVRAQILALTQELATLLKQQKAERSSSTPPANAACDNGMRKFFKKIGFKEACREVGHDNDSHGRGRGKDD